MNIFNYLFKKDPDCIVFQFKVSILDNYTNIDDCKFVSYKFGNSPNQVFIMYKNKLIEVKNREYILLDLNDNSIEIHKSKKSIRSIYRRPKFI